MGGWRFYIGFVSGVLLFFLSGAGAAEADRVVTMSFAETNAPYAWVKDGHVRGLEFDIMTAALGLAGYRLQAVARPYTRLSKVLVDEKIDGVTGLHPNELPGYHFSQPYMSYENYAIVRKDGAVNPQTVEDMLAHSVVAWRGAFEILDLEHRAPQSFVAAYEKSYLEFADQAMTYKYFWNRRSEVLLSDRHIYETYVREHPDTAKDAPAVTYLRLFPENFVQAAFRSKEVRDAFDQGLQRFKESGDYQRLVDYYFTPQTMARGRNN